MVISKGVLVAAAAAAAAVVWRILLERERPPDSGQMASCGTIRTANLRERD
jgi:hypothetical protein